MKILHTADWHLGKKLGDFPRIEEQRQVLDEICAIADNYQVDAVLVAGDLFDVPNPTVEATELFFKTLKKLSKDGQRLVLAIAGNHDSPERIESPDPLARECGIVFAGFPSTFVPYFALASGLKTLHAEPGFVSFKLPAHDYPLNVLLTPYANEIRLKSFLGSDGEEEELRNLLKKAWQDSVERNCTQESVNVLIAHLYMVSKASEKPEEPDGEKSVLHIGGAGEVYVESIPGLIQYTALGHLHRYQNVGTKEKPAVYSSSPLQYSFSEAGQNKFVCIVELKPGAVAKREKVKLSSGRKLYRKRFLDMEEAFAWVQGHPDTLLEITLVADDFIDPQHLRRLSELHDGIVQVIPEIRNVKGSEKQEVEIDLQKTTEQLFLDYYTHSRNENPSEEIIGLFREIMNE
jgi:DNA repair protein SbcD/Mre11